MRPHRCKDCRALPDGERPAVPRPAPHVGPRCATHHRARRAADRARQHERHVANTYGLTYGEYARLLEFQGGTCAIPSCPATGATKRLAVDHDHRTGQVRGLLCGPHNYELLGKFARDLQAGLDYLANPPAARLRRANEEAS